MITTIRTVIFYIGFVSLVTVLSTLTCLLFFLPFTLRQRIATTGNYLMMHWLWLTCNVRVKVTGRENVPNGPCVVLSNHQSSWEAFYMQWFFQPANFILKRELLWIPVFGWALFLMNPIAIKRSRPSSAIRYVLKQGEQRLLAGNKVVIYPEGTRIASHELGEFKTSGAALAKQANVPLLPVSHNSGEHWKRNSLLKTPGTIHMQIGPAINCQTLSAREVTENARKWIEKSLQ